MSHIDVRNASFLMSRMRSFYELFPYPNRPVFAEPNPLASLMTHVGFSRLAATGDEKSALEIWNAMRAAKSIWAAKLDEVDLQKKYERLQSLVPTQTKILMVGCGTDEPVLFRALHPGCDIVGIDLSEKALARAQYKMRFMQFKRRVKEMFFGKMLLPKGHNTFIQGDAGLLLKNASMGLFDHIQCFGVLHHQPRPQLLFKAMVESLKPNGTLRLMIYSQKGRRLERRVQRRYNEIWKQVDLGPQRGLKILKRERLKLFFWQILNTFRLNASTHYRFRYLGLNPNTVADAFMHPSDPGLSISDVCDWAKQEKLDIVFCEGKIDNQSWIAGFDKPEAVCRQLAAADEREGLASNFIAVFKKPAK